MKNYWTAEKQIQSGKKWNKYRNKMALYLWDWRKHKSARKTAEKFGVAYSQMYRYLPCSRFYQSYQKRDKYSKSDRTYATRWGIKNALVKHLGGSCSSCSETNAVLLDFHHPDPNKEQGISKIIHNSSSLSKAKKEAEKCDLLCANCHRLEHFKEQKYSDLSELIFKYESKYLNRLTSPAR